MSNAESKQALDDQLNEILGDGHRFSDGYWKNTTTKLRYLKTICKKIQDKTNKFYKTIDKFRSGHLWDKQNSGWKLKHTIYD